ncbi:MAG: TolC family protein [Saprospiraceae bacterium]|nr:TolC family protein [Saprospiraceae bacterium]
MHCPPVLKVWPFLFFCLPMASFSQNLDAYIRQGIAGNHSLKEQEFLLQKNMLALQEAKRLFFPEVSFGTTYTLAAGGRKIEIPVGDLVNPVYATLNQLTQSNMFPQLENIEETFLPNNFYDARFRIRQPILNKEIGINKSIKAAQIDLKKEKIQVYKRELVKDIKTAYFQYQQAGEAVRIYVSALELLAENQRVNESLLRNDKIIPSVLTRTAGEIANVKAQMLDAQNKQKNAAAYFNFLINRDLEVPIEQESAGGLPGILQNGQREELVQLETAGRINALVVDLENAYKVPEVGLQLDLGSQNFDFKWGGYVLAGLSVEVPIWAANRNKLQVQQAQMDVLATGEKKLAVEQQIALQAKVANNDYLTAIEIWRSYDTELAGARRVYNDTFRRYKEGLANNIELLDARTQITTKDLQQSVAFYNILIKHAELERSVAAYPLP